MGGDLVELTIGPETIPTRRGATVNRARMLVNPSRFGLAGWDVVVSALTPVRQSRAVRLPPKTLAQEQLRMSLRIVRKHADDLEAVPLIERWRLKRVSVKRELLTTMSPSLLLRGSQ